MFNRTGSGISSLFTKAFLYFSKIVLLITILSKVIVLVEHPSVLSLNDDVTRLSFRSLIIAASAFEIFLVIVLFSRLESQVKVLAILYFSLLSATYRILFHLVRQHWCPCLGNFGSWASLTQDQVNLMLDIICSTLLVGSILSIALLSKPPKRICKS